MLHASKEEMETEIGDLAALTAAVLIERMRGMINGKPGNWTQYGGQMLQCLVACRLDNNFELDFAATVRGQAPELLRILYPDMPKQAIEELLTEVIATVDKIAKRYVN